MFCNPFRLAWVWAVSTVYVYVCVCWGDVGCFPFKLLGGGFMNLTRSLSDFTGIQVCFSLGEPP